MRRQRRCGAYFCSMHALQVGAACIRSLVDMQAPQIPAPSNTYACDATAAACSAGGRLPSSSASCQFRTAKLKIYSVAMTAARRRHSRATLPCEALKGRLCTLHAVVAARASSPQAVHTRCCVHRVLQRSAPAQVHAQQRAQRVVVRRKQLAQARRHAGVHAAAPAARCTDAAWHTSVARRAPLQAGGSAPIRARPGMVGRGVHRLNQLMQAACIHSCAAARECV